MVPALLTPRRIALVGVLGIAAVALFGLVVSEPFVPTTIHFGTEDLQARAKYESIVAAHGYSFRHDKNVKGETMVVIEGIAPRDYTKIDCEYFAWDAARQRSQGVIVYDRVECAQQIIPPDLSRQAAPVR